MNVDMNFGDIYPPPPKSHVVPGGIAQSLGVQPPPPNKPRFDSLSTRCSAVGV